MSSKRSSSRFTIAVVRDPALTSTPLLNGILQLRHAALVLRLVTDMTVLLVHTDRDVWLIRWISTVSRVTVNKHALSWIFRQPQAPP